MRPPINNLTSAPIVAELTEGVAGGSHQRMVRRGWRFFHCPECEHRWKWPSRDALSPSEENCPICNEWCRPHNSEIDASIPCDDMGNLTVPWNWNPATPNAEAVATASAGHRNH